MWSLKLNTDKIDVFYSNKDYELMLEEIEKLASGNFDDRANAFIEERILASTFTRAEQVSHLESNPELRAKLRDISFGEYFAKWI